MSRIPNALTGDCIRKARIAAGLTIVQLGEAVYCAIATITLIENGVILPPLDLLESIADATGVPVETLYRKDDPTDPVIVFDRELSEKVDAAPPLTEGQRATLRPLLRLVPGRDGAG